MMDVKLSITLFYHLIEECYISYDSNIKIFSITIKL